MKHILIYTCILFGISIAQDNTVMRSLKLPPSALSTGRADNGVANPVNAAMAMHFNPAGLLFEPDFKGFNFAFNYGNHNSGLPDPDGGFYYLATSLKVPQIGAFGMSMRYLSAGEQELISEGNIYSEGTFNTYQFELGFAYAKMVTENLSAGIKASYLKEQIFLDGYDFGNGYQSKSPSTVALDFGLLYRFKGFYDTVIGASLNNLGGKMQFLVRPDGRNRYNIPTIFRLGIKSNIYEFEGHFARITGETEVRFLSAVGQSIGTNINYEFEDLFEIRMGYVFDDGVFKGKNYFTFGVGLEYDIHNLDFSSQVIGDDIGQANPSNGTPNFSYVLNLEQPYYLDEEEIPDLGYDDIEGEVDNFSYEDAERTDAEVENFDDKASNSLYDKLEREAGYEVVNTSENAEMELESEVYDEGYMERMVRTEEVKGLDYLVSDNIIMIVMAEGKNEKKLRFHISHLKYHLTDTYVGDRETFRYIKGGKGKSLVLFNTKTNNVERCYTEAKDRYVFFILDNIKYRYDRTEKKTQIVEFID